jgi:HD-GYP domain-containing protein (c-di-GMP phosphodiesterase class II)
MTNFAEKNPKSEMAFNDNHAEEQTEVPVSSGSIRSILSLSDVQENKGAYRVYMSLIQAMNTVFQSISSKNTILGKNQINELISVPLLQAMRSQREKFIGFILGGEVMGNEMAKNAVNTAILSALAAWEIKLPHHKILNIINGALLHDAGMLRLPKEIIEKRGGLSDIERQLMKSHPLLTHKIVLEELFYQEEVGRIVLQHHERWDGGGYPRSIAGEHIDLGARIVSIVDAFEAMVTPKPYRNSITGNQAVKNLLSDNSRRFDPTILKAFVLIMGIYPIGSIVRLNNGAVARVTEVRSIAPLRPKIQIIVDDSKIIYRNEKGAYLDLLTEKSLYITKAMDAKEFIEQYAS